MADVYGRSLFKCNSRNRSSVYFYSGSDGCAESYRTCKIYPTHGTCSKGKALKNSYFQTKEIFKVHLKPPLEKNSVITKKIIVSFHKGGFDKCFIF